MTSTTDTYANLRRLGRLVEDTVIHWNTITPIKLGQRHYLNTRFPNTPYNLLKKGKGITSLIARL